MENQFDVGSWEECESKISEIQEKYSKPRNPIRFRGQADSNWKLETTLERGSLDRQWTLSSYYKLSLLIKPAIETFSGSIWDLSNFEKLDQHAKNPELMQSSEELPGYSYLAHLRHNGFPSPLLDWTSSQYVAAYFAFSHAKSEKVAIYMYSEMPHDFKLHSINVVSGANNPPVIKLLGPYVKTHRRHFIQQSSYTICAIYQNEWIFVPHQRVFDQTNSSQDFLWKISIPAVERVKVLRILDRMNINAFSLFENQEGLMEMLAVREIDLKQA